jgi:hypothetical protein
MRFREKLNVMLENTYEEESAIQQNWEYGLDEQIVDSSELVVAEK